ncbi:MAG: ferritin-like domain-containing protein [Aridibacter famidurans]|nr:ferritin-like domain-containing protein [Aridibacter famidurans]
MPFETNRDVLDWYESQPRALTDEYISEIPWGQVNEHPLDQRLIPVLLYMRDIEILTDMYHQELLRTPTGKDPVISKFMERWGVEEITHGELINRFINEAGVETPRSWKEEITRSVSSYYHAYARILTTLTNCVGKSFTATHMTYGTINELSAAQSYRRLIEIADHPVLTHILKGIIREESVHTQFYLNVARLELKQSRFARKIARFVIDWFWQPVGSGTRSKPLTDYTVGVLFGDSEGVEWIDRLVTDKVRVLPGFDGMNAVTERIAEVGRRGLNIRSGEAL